MIKINLFHCSFSSKSFLYVNFCADILTGAEADAVAAHALNHGQHRGLLRQQRHKTFQRRALPFQLQLHAGGGVFYVAAEAAAAHQLMHKRPEAHTLHNAADF